MSVYRNDEVEKSKHHFICYLLLDNIVLFVLQIVGKFNFPGKKEACFYYETITNPLTMANEKNKSHTVKIN
jgi:hypothetical protein